MSEIAAGYVSIVPKFGSGFKSGIEKELGAAGSGGGKQAGASFGGTFLGVLGGNIATKAVAAITTPIRASFAGGWNRLMAIEQAETTLSALGLDVKASMKSVDDAVTGTKFAISDAAGMAGILGASGVKAGEDMTKWLKLTANAAQFTGRDFGEIQAIMTEVVGSGRITGETLNRLPIAASALAKELGVSQEEVRKLASQGKISADDFERAMSGTLGSLAEQMGTTTDAMLANIKTAMNATMANLLTPALNAMQPLLAATLPVMQGIRDVAEGAGQAIGEWLQPRAEALGEAISRLPAAFEAFGSKASAVASAVGSVLGPVVGQIREAVAGFIDGFGGLDAIKGTLGQLLPLLAGPLGAIRAALLGVFSSGSEGIDFAGWASSIGAALSPVLQGLGQLASVLTGTLAAAFTQLVPLVGELLVALVAMSSDLASGLLPAFAELASGVLPIVTSLIASLISVVAEVYAALFPLVTMLIGELAPILLDLVSAVLPPLLSVFGTLGTAVTDLVTALAPLVTALASALAPVLSIVASLLPPLAGALMQIVDTVLGAVLPALTSLVQTIAGVLVPAIEILAPIVEAVFGVIASVIGSAMEAVAGIIKAVTGIITGDWEMAWEGIRQYTGAIWDQIQAVVRAAIDAVAGIVRDGVGLVMTAMELLGALAALAAKWFGGFLTSAQTKLCEAVEFVRGIPAKLIAALGNLATLLINSGRSLIQGLADGIKQGFAAAVSAVTSGLQTLRSYFPFSPPKKGPFSGKGYTTHAGKKLLEDFGVGITKGQGSAVKAGDKAMKALSGKLGTEAKKAANAAVKEAEKIDKAFADTVKKIETAQLNIAKILSRDYWGAVSGTAKQATSTLNKIIDEINKVKLPKTSALAKYVEQERDNLARLLATRDNLAAKIKDATANLNALIDEQNKFVEGIYRSSFDLGAMFSAENAADMATSLRQQIAATRDFANTLAELRKMGISDELLRQLAEAGVEKGGEAARAIKEGGAEAVAELTALEKRLAAESQRLAKTLGAELYDAGIAAARGLVDGLQSQHNAVVQMARRLAIAIHAEIKKELQIHSPSRVTTRQGEQGADGLVRGMLSRLGATRRAAQALADAAVPQAGVTGRAQLAAAGGAGQSLHIGTLNLQLPDHVRDFDALVRFLRDFPRQAAAVGRG